MAGATVGYARISEDDQRTGLGVARQQEDIEKLCHQQGWELLEVIVDNDSSASRYARKPRTGYQQMLAVLEAGTVSKVVVYDVDRLLRDPRELEDLIDLAERKPGLRIHNVTGELRLDTADGRFIARILVAKAAKESDDTSRRITRKMLELAENGQPNGGRRPYGFASNRIDHEPAEADALRRAAKTVLAGGTLAAGARHTGLDGSTVKRILTSARVAGLRQHHGETIGPAVWQPIIDRAEWERLRALLLRPSRYSVPHARHLLTGFARCGECGSNLSAQIRRAEGGRVIYQCRSVRGGCGRVSVDGARLEAHVVEEVGELVRSTKVRRIAQRHLDGSDDGEAELLALLAADERRLTDLAAQVGELQITTVEWQAMRRPILERIEAARADLARTARRATVKVDLSDVAERWTSFTTEELRTWFALFGVEVKVAKAGRQARRFNASRATVTPGWA